MSSLVIPAIESVESEANYGRFCAEPLEKGVGVTLGNAMRRILLGFLPGAAVTRVKIEGIEHEFSVIPYAREDAMEFLLNLKGLRLKPISGRPAKLVLEMQGEGAVTAANIRPSADFEIANPELYLFTLSSPQARFYAEFDVEMGIGFKQAESTDNMPVGAIPVDAIFTPMRKVNFSIEPIHVGRETSRERLFLDVWTDGTISPTDAMSNGAGILIEQLSPFVEYAKVSQMKAEERLIRLAIPDEKFNMPVEQLDLSVRTMNCLRRSGITTVGEIVGRGRKELMKLRNFGQKSFQEIESRLNVMGLSFGSPEQVEGETAGADDGDSEPGEESPEGDLAGEQPAQAEANVGESGK